MRQEIVELRDELRDRIVVNLIEMVTDGARQEMGFNMPGLSRNRKHGYWSLLVACRHYEQGARSRVQLSAPTGYEDRISIQGR